jgi:ribosomal protein L7Ae-like RNA K-turn-binding protein
MSMKLYLQVTKDEYELPLIIADNAKELGRLTGHTANYVLSVISKGYKGWARIEVEDDD